jgi:PmbA protein
MLQRFIDAFTKEANQTGIDRLEFYIKECQGQTVQVYKQEVERISLSDETLVFIEGEYEGYKGSTFVESIGSARISEHLNVIRQIAQHNKEPFKPRPTFTAQARTKGIVHELPSIEKVTEWLKQGEQRAYGFDKRVDNVGVSSHTTHREKVTLLGAQGDRLEDTVQFDRVRMSLVARDGAAVQSAFESRLGTSIDQETLLSLADQAAEKVVSQLEASPVKTGQYAIILQNSLVCDLILAFVPGLYADRAQKKMSVLANKVGQTITSSLFSLVEDPHLPSGIVTRSFDDEGTPTQGKAIIEAGRLTTLLHNLETARAFKVQSTGNGFKSLYREQPAVSPTNLYVPSGTYTLPEMMKEMRSGLLITDCDGISAGANSVSGDFSLIAKGYLVENGAIQRAVNQITIGGNYYEMLNNVSVVGSEYATGGSSGGFIQAPSLLVNQLFVSGT